MSWDGHVVSDCTAIELMGDAKYDDCAPPYPPLSCKPEPFSGHNYTRGVVDTAQVALAAGTDVNCGPFYRMWLGGLLANGSVTAAAVDTAVTRVYRTALRLGLLDPSVGQVYPTLGAEVVDSPAHRALALRAARESLVLLVNHNAALPLVNSGTLRLAFIGPHANTTQGFLANYHGDNKLVDSHSPLLVARARGLDVTYARGCNICDVVPPGFPNMPCPPGKAGDRSGIPAAVAAAAAADVAVVFVGLDETSEAENFDRHDLLLPGVQEDLVRAVLAAQPRTVVVVVSGGVVSSPLLATAPALLQAFYGGELAGDAIVDALTGVVSPAGKLPLTVYYNNVTARDIRDMDLARAGGITHSYFTGPVLFPFGAGLSFTTWQFAATWGEGALGGSGAELVVTRAQLLEHSDATLALTARVSNAGNRASDCVVLVFVTPLGAEGADASHGAARPARALAAFARLHAVAPGETRAHTLRVSLDRPADATLRALLGDELRQGPSESGTRAWEPLPGRYAVAVGDVDAPARLTLTVVL